MRNLIGLKDKRSMNVTCNGNINGYYLHRYENDVLLFGIRDMGFDLLVLSCDNKGMFIPKEFNYDVIDDFEIDNFKEKFYKQYDFFKNLDTGWSTLDQLSIYYSKEQGVTPKQAYKLSWIIHRENIMAEGLYENEIDFVPYYKIQNDLKERIVKEGKIDCIKYIAGADVAYDDNAKHMVGAITILDVDTLEMVDFAIHEMQVNFPYVPGLFSFREVPPLKEAFKKLKIKPDLIICDGHGIAHPNGIGMASHLGLELDVPTIGCAKSRLVGYYDKEKLGKERGSMQELIWNDNQVGVALRTQDNVKPVFVSVGHKINLETAVDTVLKMSQKYRLPETTRFADQIVNQKIKERFKIDLLNDDEVTT